MTLKKSIGVLTFQNSDNYGALLQTFATQYILEKYGFKPEVINYYSPNKRGMYKLISFGRGYTLKNFLGSMIRFPERYPRWRRAEHFRKSWLHLSLKKYQSFDELSRDINNWPIIIAGSDQIWNYENTGFDRTYLLDFKRNGLKKVAYAASFGVPEISTFVPESVKKYHPEMKSLKKEYQNMLNDFDEISVREKVGSKIVSELINREVDVVLDPTLLLTKDEWLEVAKVKKTNEKYILVYSIDNKSELFELARKMGKYTGMEVRQIFRPRIGKKFGIRNIQPQFIDFVSCIVNASIILTDSFHGTAFSINMGKPFYVFYHSGKNNYSRIDNLLDLVGLEDRKVYSREDLISIDPFDYKVAHERLNNARKKSLAFLLKSLQE